MSNPAPCILLSRIHHDRRLLYRIRIEIEPHDGRRRMLVQRQLCLEGIDRNEILMDQTGRRTWATITRYAVIAGALYRPRWRQTLGRITGIALQARDIRGNIEDQP